MTALQTIPGVPSDRRPGSTAGATPRLLAGLGACICACIICITFLDRPIALFIHGLVREPGSASNAAIMALSRTSDLHNTLALLIAASFGLAQLVSRWRGTGRSRSAVMRVACAIGLSALAVVLSSAVKSILKIVFGRTWPEPWLGINPSLTRDGVFGFFPFTTSIGFDSFPSGHMAAACAAMTVLWLLLPRGRALFATAAGLAGVGLLGMNLHFLSDILAGACLGWISGELVVRYAVRYGAI